MPGEQWQLLADIASLRGLSGDESGADSARVEAVSIVAALAARIADTQLRDSFVRATSAIVRIPVN